MTNSKDSKLIQDIEELYRRAHVEPSQRITADDVLLARDIYQQITQIWKGRKP